MKRLIGGIAILVTLFCATLALAGGDFDDFLTRVNVSASADFGAFRARLGATFGKPEPEIDLLIKSVPTPADAYMCLRVAETARQPLNTVVTEFNANRDKGWGVIAKNLGIKPGSKEFHALKEGNFDTAPQTPQSSKNKAKGKHK